MYLAICYPTYFRVAIPLKSSRALIPTPSCSSMHPKWSGSKITSKNAKIYTLDLYNFFLAGYFLTKFWETFYMYKNIIYPKFALILRSQKKIDFS
jgi:hypothetical protein